MKILVIFTGGTIGSVVSDGWISPDDEQSYLLLEHYKAVNGDSDVSFETTVPYTVLSENISAENINVLIACIMENITKDYDGIIVTHGTDTLQYTAAAIGFAVGAALPVVLVSSNYPLDDARNNGHENFAAAIELIREGEKGVFAAYRNNDGIVYYHHASRLLRHSEATDDLYSLQQPYGFYEDGRFKKNNTFQTSAAGVPCGAFTLTEQSGILNILSHPGDDFRYSLDGVCAILIQPYHSGTINTVSADFASFCEEAAKRDIPVFLANVPDGTTYSSAKNFDDLQLIPLPLCAAITLYMKLWIAVSLGTDLRTFVQTPLFEEFLTF